MRTADERTGPERAVLAALRWNASDEEVLRHAAPELERDGAAGLIATAVSQRVLVQVERRLAAAGVCSPELSEAASAVRGIVGGRSFAAEALEAMFLARSAAAGVPVVRFKGPDLGRRLYGAADVRPSVDVDVLVERRRFHEAVRIAEDLGLAAAPDVLDRHGMPLLHRTMNGGEGVPSLEVHWRPHWYEETFTDAAIARGAGARLAPADELVALLLVYARDGVTGVRYPADLAAWWKRYGAEVDLEAVRGTLRSHPQLRRPVAVAARAVGAVLGVPLPPLLRGPRTARTALAVQLAQPFPARDVAEVDARTAVVDVLAAPMRQLPWVFTRRTLVPRAAIEGTFPDARSVRAQAPAVLRRVEDQLAVVRAARR